MCTKRKQQDVQKWHAGGPPYALYTGVTLLEAPLSYPFVPVRACAVQCTLVLYGVLDDALTLENLKSEAHGCVPGDKLVEVGLENEGGIPCQSLESLQCGRGFGKYELLTSQCGSASAMCRGCQSQKR